VPGHDARLTSTVSAGQQEDVDIEFHFSAAMNCDSVTSNLKITSTTEDGTTPKVVKKSVECLTVPPQHLVHFVGNIPTTWTYKAKLTGVSNGVHELTLTNVTAQNGGGSTGVSLI
jgi:alpha-1,3-glucan synthase